MKRRMMKQKITQLKKRHKTLLEKKLFFLEEDVIHRYRPHIKQQLFHSKSNQQERLFLAGNRCGKTYCGAIEMAIHLTGDYPNWWQGRKFDKPIRAWAASVTSEATRDILQRTYLGDPKNDTKGVIPESKIRRMTMKRGVSGAIDTVYVQHVSGGVSTLGFKSFDQGREKFQGTSKDVIHLDEEPDMRIYEECLMRTMDTGGLMMLTMTPLKGMSDVCFHFMENNSDNKSVVQAAWDDTHHLNENEKKRLRASLRSHEIEAREKGIPSLGAGKVFPLCEEDIAVDRFDIPAHFKRCFGLDFGWRNPTAAVWLAYDAEAEIVYVTDVYSQSETTPADHVAHLNARGKWIPGVADPAGFGASQADGVSLMQRYAEHGLYLQAAENTVESGIMHVLELMQAGRFKVFRDLAPWWQEFRLYRRSERGKIVKQKDHLMDATRYAVVSGLNIASVEPKTKAKTPVRRDAWTI